MQQQPKKDLIPLYSRVSSIIQNKILSGQYEPRDKLPTEDELVEYFGVSKITVRNALALLESRWSDFPNQRKRHFCSTGYSGNQTVYSYQLE